MNWFEIDNIDGLDSPALVVYPSRVKKNIETLILMIDDVGRLRPHVKTHKSPDVTGMLMAAGIHKFKCATIAEAEMLGICHAADVLLAYPPTGPKLHRFVQLFFKYPDTKYACLVDNAESAATLAKTFAAYGLRVPVYIDLDTGMGRTGINVEAAGDLWHSVRQMDGIIPAGLHAYDGHLLDPDFTNRKKLCDEGFEPVLALQKKLGNPTVIAGGSPTYSIHSKRDKVECSPGTFIYWDKRYLDSCAEQDFIPGAVLVTRVISLPGPATVCVDLGHKSVASENGLSQRVHFLNAPELVFLKQSEEHLVLGAGEGHPYKIGDVLYGLPVHVCPTVALYERVFTIENNRISGEWPTAARDRKINI